MTLLSILLLGFVLGMRHATDSDHVIAVSTIVSRQRHILSSAVTGVFWGIGHSITLLLVGGAIILFGIVIPQRLGLSFEFCVAIMLTLLGAINLRLAFRSLRGTTTQAHEQPEIAGRHWRPALIGVTHGLAGSAAVALLILPIVRNSFWAMLYLIVFGLGTIAGMMVITVTVAVPINYTKRFALVQRHLCTAAGLVSLSFGLFLVYQIGYVDGLFR